MFQTLDGVPSTTSIEGGFELVGDRWHYTENGTVVIPFGSDPIQLDAAIRAAAICEPACSIETELGDTLRVGNARLLDPKGLPLEGEIASESGHDYTVPVPEPGGTLSTLAGAVVLALTRRRAGGKRRRGARAHGH